MIHPLRATYRALALYLSKSRAVETHFGTSRFDLLKASLHKGDVLLVDGSSRISTAIKYLTQSSWSHAALYVGDAMADLHPEFGPNVLIEADVVEGVRALPLAAYRGMHTRICRPVGLGSHEIDGVIAHVVNRLGQRYDMRNLFDLLRYLLPTPPLPGRWRRRLLELGSGEPTQAICSSLIAAAFHSARYPILPAIEPEYRRMRGTRKARKEILRIRSSQLFTPRDFDISPFFLIVKPMIERNFDPHLVRWVTRPPTDQHAPGARPGKPAA